VPDRPQPPAPEDSSRAVARVRAVLTSQDGRFHRVLGLGDATPTEAFILDPDPAPLAAGTYLRVDLEPADPARAVTLFANVSYVWTPAVAAQHGLPPGYFLSLRGPFPALADHLGLHRTAPAPQAAPAEAAPRAPSPARPASAQELQAVRPAAAPRPTPGEMSAPRRPGSSQDLSARAPAAPRPPSSGASREPAALRPTPQPQPRAGSEVSAPGAARRPGSSQDLSPPRPSAAELRARRPASSQDLSTPARPSMPARPTPPAPTQDLGRRPAGPGAQPGAPSPVAGTGTEPPKEPTAHARPSVVPPPAPRLSAGAMGGRPTDSVPPRLPEPTLDLSPAPLPPRSGLDITARQAPGGVIVRIAIELGGVRGETVEAYVPFPESSRPSIDARSRPLAIVVGPDRPSELEILPPGFDPRAA
jgi:hypothetical protein